MRVFVLWRYHQTYLDHFYRSRPQLVHAPSNEQVRALLADFFTWQTAVASHLSDWGAEIEILIPNARPLISRVAGEMGIPDRGAGGEFSVIEERIRRVEPDALWIGPTLPYQGSRLRALRKHCRRVFTWIASPLHPLLDLDGIDCVITSHDNFVERFQASGLASRKLLPAFDEGILESLGSRACPERDIDLSFIGSLSWAHRRRIEILDELVREARLRLWTLRQPLISRSLLRPGFYRTALSALRLRRRSEGEIFGLDMFEILARSRLTLNVHIGVADGLAGNQRMFEASGMGAVLLTESAPNLSELFEPDREVITYETVAELKAKSRALLADDRERMAIAQRGREKTLKRHTARVRSRELLDILSQ